MISGFATAKGTALYQGRFPQLHRTHFRPALELTLSSLGLGTYLGDADDSTDSLLENATRQVVRRGINVIDTAIVYRHMRSERALGRALAQLIPSEFSREELIIATKGGFLAFDPALPMRPEQDFEHRFVSTGLCRPDDVVERRHCLAPPFLAYQLDQSRQNLGLETVDIYFLHNPECQLTQVRRSVFHGRIEAAFSFLEEAVSEGKIRFYGLATWNGFRVPEDRFDYLALDEMLAIAENVAGIEHHFRAIQLPLNPAMPEALVLENQSEPSQEPKVSLLEAAADRGLAVLTSASTGQGRLALGLSEADASLFGGLETEPQRALQLVRSLAEVTTALVGMKQREHIEENLRPTGLPTMLPAQAQRFFESGS